MRRHSLFLTLPALLLLAGCGATSVSRPDLRLPERFTADTRGQDVHAAPAQTLDRWWLLFSDAQLTALEDQALAHAPDARSALAMLDEARATRSKALLAYDVQGNASGSITRGQTTISGMGAAGAFFMSPIGATTTSAGSFSPSWELDLFGRRGAARQAADADLVTATFTYHAALQSLTAQVATNLFEARGLSLQLVEARDSLRVAAELADIGVRKAHAGIGADVDADSLIADRATAQANVVQLEAQLAVSRQTLLVLLGRVGDAADSLPVDGALGPPPAVPATTPATLLVRRPDVVQAEARLRSAMGSLHLDSLALLPKFSLQPTASISAIAGPAGYTTSLWSLAAGVAMPVFDRARLLGEVRAQRARAEQAAIAYEKAVQTGYGEAQNQLATYAADRTRLSLLVEAEARARHAFDGQNAGYRAGVVDLTALLTAERSWRSSRSALSSLRATTLSDAVNVFRALGGGWTPLDPTHPVTSFPDHRP
ncbi:MAG: TolC family protein [Sphingomonadales bacterium]|nr:TolC family protein [Sphingomonadales bacterium]